VEGERGGGGRSRTGSDSKSGRTDSQRVELSFLPFSLGRKQPQTSYISARRGQLLSSSWLGSLL
jgi:hypothetical protein